MKNLMGISFSLCVLFIVSIHSTNAQYMMQKAAITNAGGITSSPTTRFEYTAGESAIGTSSNGTTVGHFGFWNTGNSVSGVGSVLTLDAIRSLRISPNPAKSIVTIDVSLARQGLLDIELYNPAGSKIATLYSGQRNAGEFRMYYNVQGLAQGAYIIAASLPGVLAQSQFTVVR